MCNLWRFLASLSYAFIEQGFYMLMMVLEGEQAIAQSKAVIRLFKQMEGYITAENAPDVSARMVALAMQTGQNTRCIVYCSRGYYKMKNRGAKYQQLLL